MLDSAVQWTNHYPADFLACLDSRRDCCAQGYFLAKRERRSPEGFSLAARVPIFMRLRRLKNYSTHLLIPPGTKATDFSEIFPVNSAIHLLNIPSLSIRPSFPFSPETPHTQAKTSRARSHVWCKGLLIIHQAPDPCILTPDVSSSPSSRLRLCNCYQTPVF